MVKIFPLPSAGWRVEIGGREQPYLFPTKSQAISFALTWSESHQPAEILVFGAIGELERTIRFPNGGHRRAHGTDRRHRQIAIPFPDRRQQERRRSA